MQASRNLRAIIFALVTFAALAHAGCFSPGYDTATYYLAAPLVPAGAGGGGGHVELLLTSRQRDAFVEVEGLEPDAAYTVTVGDAALVVVVTDATGRGSAVTRIAMPELDPRGQRIAVADAGGLEVLELAAPDHPAYDEAEIATLGAFGPGAGQVITVSRGGRRSVTAALFGVEPAVYDLVIDGVALGSLDAADGLGVATVDGIAFDPRNAVIELTRDGVGWFAGSGRALLEGLDWCGESQATQALAAAASGVGHASLATRVDCGRRFEVAITDVPLGAYDVVVGGVVRGTIMVGADENGVTSGSLGFGSSGGDEPLDFDPLGQPIEVRGADQAYFSLPAFHP